MDSGSLFKKSPAEKSREQERSRAGLRRIDLSDKSIVVAAVRALGRLDQWKVAGRSGAACDPGAAALIDRDSFTEIAVRAPKKGGVQQPGGSRF